MGLMNGRKLKKDRKNFRDNRLPDKKKRLGISLKFDPIGRAAQAKGIVTKKIQKEAKQPNSAMRKCCRVQLIKTGKRLRRLSREIWRRNLLMSTMKLWLRELAGNRDGQKGIYRVLDFK